MYISNGHFYLAVLGPGVLTDVIASVTSLHDYMMLICITICRTQQTSLLTTTVSSSHRKEGLQKHRCRPCVKNRLTYMQNFCVDLQPNFCLCSEHIICLYVCTDQGPSLCYKADGHHHSATEATVAHISTTNTRDTHSTRAYIDIKSISISGVHSTTCHAVLATRSN